MSIQNQVQLITYPDSLGGDLKQLHKVLKTYFPDVFKGGIHLLPPFPSSGDRGFAPIDYREIDPRFGSWEDVRAIGQSYDLMLDLMVNHVSRQSPYFQDFLKYGSESRYADMFIPLQKLWPDGRPVQEQIDRMFLRRTVPFSTFTIEKTGQEINVWTTFGKTDPSEQIDLDIHAESVKTLFRDTLRHFKAHGVKIVRLDAVGYVIKKLGTSCFFVEPDIYHVLDWFQGIARSLDMEILPEVHAHYTLQYKLSEKGYWIYDFILPYRILDTLVNRNSLALQNYLKERPARQFTMLDCHDGIPVKPDLDDLIDTGEARRLVEHCLARGANLSRILSGAHRSEDGFDVHQIRGSYYAMLDCHDDAYLAARAIQFFTPGIPQVYYVGLLAGKDDEERVKETVEGREINRSNFRLRDIEKAVRKDVVQRLLRLIRFRNEYEAFQGQFQVFDTPQHELRLQWRREEQQCTLSVDLRTYRTLIHYIDQTGNTREYVV